MPYGRDIRPRNQRRAESLACARSGASAISERDMLRTVLMVNTDGQIYTLADEDTFITYAALISTAPPHVRRVPVGLDLREEPYHRGRSPRVYGRLHVPDEERLG
eukprot:1321346-Pyramimonas_sp.AAC.1